jgi:uncharacterized protein YwqG
MTNYLENNTVPQCDVLSESALQAIADVYRNALDPESGTGKKAQSFSLEAHTETLTKSRLGGQAPWFQNTPVPVNTNGEALLFIAQIQISDMRETLPMPENLEHFALQFYIDNDDVFGCDFPSRENNSDPQNTQGAKFRVLLVDTRELNILAATLEPEPEFSIFTWPNPTTQNRALVKNDLFTSMPSYEEATGEGIATQVTNIVAQHTTLKPYQIDSINELEDEYFDAVEDAEDENDGWGRECYVGGYPDFTQSDPRTKRNGTDGHTLNLLSLGYSDNILIGDAGRMHFLIREDRWLAGDLSDVIYNWDCH